MPTLTREELYDLVWSEPVRTIAPHFGMSDVAFRKHVVAARVPSPDRGYWAKLAAGKKVARTPLPARDPGATDSVLIGPSPGWYSEPEARLAEPVPAEPTFAEAIESVRARVERRLGKVTFERTLTTPHAALRKLVEAEAKRIAAYAKSNYFWDKPLFESGFEKRRLKILNSLAIGLSKQGCHLEVRGKPARELIATVGHTGVRLTLDHPNAKANRHGEWETRDGPAADPLRLLIASDEGKSAYPVFADEGEARLEAKLTALTLEIIVAGEAEYRRRRLANYAWQLKERERLKAEVEKKRQEAERRALERRLAQEKARREHLFGQAAAWRTARDIRGFVAEVIANQDAASDETRAWADWALSEADALDPVRSGGLNRPTGV